MLHDGFMEAAKILIADPQNLAGARAAITSLQATLNDLKENAYKSDEVHATLHNEFVAAHTEIAKILLPSNERSSIRCSGAGTAKKSRWSTTRTETTR